MTDDEKPKPTRERLQQILAASSGRLPAAAIVAQVRAAGFEITTGGPIPYDAHEAPPGNGVWPSHLYWATIVVEGIEHGATNITGVNDDPTVQTHARLLVARSVIDKAASPGRVTPPSPIA